MSPSGRYDFDSKMDFDDSEFRMTSTTYEDNLKVSPEVKVSSDVNVSSEVKQPIRPPRTYESRVKSEDKALGSSSPLYDFNSNYTLDDEYISRHSPTNEYLPKVDLDFGPLTDFHSDIEYTSMHSPNNNLSSKVSRDVDHSSSPLNTSLEERDWRMTSPTYGLTSETRHSSKVNSKVSLEDREVTRSSQGHGEDYNRNSDVNWFRRTSPTYEVNSKVNTEVKEPTRSPYILEVKPVRVIRGARLVSKDFSLRKVHLY